MKHLLRTYPEKIRYFISMWLTHLINGGKNLNAINPTRILVFKEDEIGDLCNSLHVLTMLKKEFITAEIHLLCKPFVQSLVTHHPDISKIHTNYSTLSGYFDLQIDLRGSWQSIAFAIKHKPKWRFDRGTVRYKNSKLPKHPHEVITNLQIVEPIISVNNRTTQPQLYLSPQLPQKVSDFLAQNKLTKFAVLHTGARKNLRKWNKFDVLASHLKKNLQLDVVFAGDRTDVVEITNWQQKIAFKTYSIANQFNLLEFAYLVKQATIYIGNESGPLHIASACNTPTLGLFGPGEPDVFYPWGKNSTYLHHVLACNPCAQISCSQITPCIQLISIDEVKEKIKLIIPTYEIRH